MNRREFLKNMSKAALALGAIKFIGGEAMATSNPGNNTNAADTSQPVEKITKPDAEWKKELPPESYEVLRHEGTEAPFTSPLNNEKHDGVFVCAACGFELFPSKFKFDSGTGWPSFYDTIQGHVETKSDYKIVMPRTEYHCAQCGGHQGHVFNDGPAPTGLRYCNNGVALKFVPKTT